MTDDGTAHITRLLRVEEAARLLSIGRTTAYTLIASGQLRAIHLGRSTRISEHEVERFIRSAEASAGSAVTA